MTKPTILVIGFYIPGTGFTRVLSHILAGIKQDYCIHYYGVGYTGKPFEEDGAWIYPEIDDTNNQYTIVSLAALASQIHPDIIFMLHDLRFQQGYLQTLHEQRGRCRFLSYTPLDGKVVDVDSIAPVFAVDTCILYTQFAREQILQLFKEQIKSEQDLDFNVIPHGVDCSTFYPLSDEERLKARLRLFPGIPDPEDAFIVLNANRADPRKRLDITMEGFALFAKGKPQNVKLYLHHPFIDQGKKLSLMKLADEYTIRDRLILYDNENGNGTAPVTDQQLNEIYNACDVGVNTAMGEGWGLISLEHAACAVPQIVPRHSAFTEIWESAADMLEPVYEKVPWFSEFSMSAVSPVELSTKLERLYQDKQYHAAMAKAAWHRATEPRFNWDNISLQWAALFKNLKL